MPVFSCHLTALSLNSSYENIPFSKSSIAEDDKLSGIFIKRKKLFRFSALSLQPESEKENIEILVENAVEINENPDREAFAALCQPVYDVFNEQMGTDEYLTMVQDFVATLR